MYSAFGKLSPPTMFFRVLFVVLILSQLGYGKTPRRMKTAPIVRRINESPGLTWKASTYGRKEINLKEFARTKLGTEIDVRHEKKVSFEPDSVNATSDTTLPEAFTWANTNRTKCLFPILDQANCGSCWALAATSVMTDKFCLATNGTFRLPLSFEHVVACDYNNYGCNGAKLSTVFPYLKENGTVTGGGFESDAGCQTYSIRPCGTYYTMHCDKPLAFTPKCRKNKCSNDWYKYDREKTTYKISDYQWINAYYSDTVAKKEIYDNGPIFAVFWVYPDFLVYQKGIYVHKYGIALGGHAVKVIGWGIDNGTKYWHVANSWGTNWGEDGYFRIRRGTGECSLEYYMYKLAVNATNIS